MSVICRRFDSVSCRRPLIPSLVLAGAILALADRSLVAGEAVSDEVAAELAAFKLPAGYEIALFASEPAVIKPVQINFDVRGRLWVSCMPNYPHIYPEQVPRDYITVLDDADGDGKAESAKVFVDGLLMATGMAPGDGGCYIGCMRELVHYSDTNGDGKADRRRVLCSGFGKQDTHHTVNSFQWGVDGRLYFNQGVYAQSHVETSHGVRDLVGGGVWAWHPRRMELEIFDTTLKTMNVWGHAIDAWGQSYITVPWPGGIFQVFPALSATGTNRALQAGKVGAGRHCGATIVNGPHVTDDLRGNLLSGEFKKRQVSRYKITDDGAKVALTEVEPLVTSTHPAFRPVDVTMGPDGAIYISDFYNQVINHAEVDFASPRRDHTHGRIWRVTAKGRQSATRPTLADATIPALVAQVGTGEDWTRSMARRALAERDQAEVAKAVEAAVPALLKPEASPRAVINTLWLCQQIDRVDESLLRAAVSLGHEHARAAAVRVLHDWHSRIADPYAILEKPVTDPAARVRFEAVLVLSRLNDLRALPLLAKAVELPLGPRLDPALREAYIGLRGLWEPALAAGKTDLGGAKAREFAQAAVGVKGK